MRSEPIERKQTRSKWFFGVLLLSGSLFAVSCAPSLKTCQKHPQTGEMIPPGKVKLKVRIGPDGRCESAEVLQSNVTKKMEKLAIDIALNKRWSDQYKDLAETGGRTTVYIQELCGVSTLKVKPDVKVEEEPGEQDQGAEQ